MSLGPAGVSLDAENAGNFEDVSASPLIKTGIFFLSFLTTSQMEKQFAVKGS